ncbi:MAG: HAMP domain-containing protein, partial [Steroidobacteraceae bacterium]
MTVVSLKLKYASAAFVAVLLAMAAVTVLLVWQHDTDARHLGAMAEDSARQRVDVELRARASSTAAHAADSIINAIRTQDTVTVARRLLPFIEDPTVAAITVMDSTGSVVYTWHRSAQAQKGVLQAEATEPVRTLVESIPGAATPQTFGTVKVLLEQAAPVPETSLKGRLIAASASQSRLGLILAAALAILVGLLGAAIAWRAAHKIERPIDALIKSAERIGQGDYTRPLEVRRRDVLGELQQALERMRARLRQYTINKSYLHSVLNSMTDAVFVTSPDGVVKLANSAACKLLGYGEEEILGRGIAAMLDERERESFDLVQAAQE